MKLLTLTPQQDLSKFPGFGIHYCWEVVDENGNAWRSQHFNYKQDAYTIKNSGYLIMHRVKPDPSPTSEICSVCQNV